MTPGKHPALGVLLTVALLPLSGAHAHIGAGAGERTDTVHRNLAMTAADTPRSGENGHHEPGWAQVADAELAERIYRRIDQEPTLPQGRILVEVDNGVIHLSGWVDTPQQEERLYRIIGEIPQVERLESEVIVDPYHGPFPYEPPVATAEPLRQA